MFNFIKYQKIKLLHNIQRDLVFNLTTDGGSLKSLDEFFSSGIIYNVFI